MIEEKNNEFFLKEQIKKYNYLEEVIPNLEEVLRKKISEASKSFSFEDDNVVSFNDYAESKIQIDILLHYYFLSNNDKKRAINNYIEKNIKKEFSSKEEMIHFIHIINLINLSHLSIDEQNSFLFCSPMRVKILNWIKRQPIPILEEEVKKQSNSMRFTEVIKRYCLLFNIPFYDEKNLGEHYQNEEDSIITYQTEMRKYRILTKEEEPYVLIDAYMRQGNARDELVKANLRLVKKIAESYAKNKEEEKDFIQEGNIGLLWAVDKMDICRIGKFSTYATFLIRREISRKRTHLSAISFPFYLRSTFRKIIMFKEDYIKIKGCYPNDEEVCKSLNISVQTLDVFNLIFSIVSYDKLLEEEFEDLLKLEDYSFEETIERNMTQEQIQELLSETNLTDIERNVISHRYGFEEKPKTLREIGESMNRTKQRISLIEQRSIKKLRKTLSKEEFIQIPNNKVQK